MQEQIKYILIIIFVIFSTNSFSQSINERVRDLQKKEKELKENISIITKKINLTQKEGDQLNKTLIEKQSEIVKLTEKFSLSTSLITIQQELIIEKENQIRLNKQEIDSNLKILNDLKENYKQMVLQRYIWDNTHHETNFLISSKSLTQMYQRKAYLIFLRKQRSEQIEKIKEVNEKLLTQQNNLIKEKNRLSVKVLEYQKQRKETETQKKELVISKNTIQKEKKALEYKVKEFNSKKSKVQKEIQEIIKKIIVEESKRKKENNFSVSHLTMDARIPWPIESGEIVELFGEKRSPKGIKTKNNGIDFSTNVGEICYSVAEGEVSAIALVGIGKAVIINHGGFYTVYSGLENISVKKGDKVGLKQKIGVVVTSKTTLKTILHFEIWKGKIPQNPDQWLYIKN